MRITTLTLLSILAFTLMVSCKKKTKKEDTTIIDYPANVYYGEVNILSLPDGGLGSGTYGMGAALGKDAKLKVVITNLSTYTNTTVPEPLWFFSNSIGWVISDYNTGNRTQTFTSISTDKVDVDISFSPGGGQGSCKIELYENSSSVTKTKYFHW